MAPRARWAGPGPVRRWGRCHGGRSVAGAGGPLAAARAPRSPAGGDGGAGHPVVGRLGGRRAKPAPSRPSSTAAAGGGPDRRHASLSARGWAPVAAGSVAFGAGLAALAPACWTRSSTTSSRCRTGRPGPTYWRWLGTPGSRSARCLGRCEPPHLGRQRIRHRTGPDQARGSVRHSAGSIRAGRSTPGSGARARPRPTSRRAPRSGVRRDRGARRRTGGSTAELGALAGAWNARDAPGAGAGGSAGDGADRLDRQRPITRDGAAGGSFLPASSPARRRPSFRSSAGWRSRMSPISVRRGGSRGCWPVIRRRRSASGLPWRTPRQARGPRAPGGTHQHASLPAAPVRGRAPCRRDQAHTTRSRSSARRIRTRWRRSCGPRPDGR